MLTAIILTLKNIFGWISLHKKIVLYAVAGIILFVLIFSFFRSCGKKEIKFDEKTILEAQKAIAENDRKKMVDILSKSDADEAIADGIIANSKGDAINAQNQSKEKYKDLSNEDIASELNRRAKE